MRHVKTVSGSPRIAEHLGTVRECTTSDTTSIVATPVAFVLCLIHKLLPNL